MDKSKKKKRKDLKKEDFERRQGSGVRWQLTTSHQVLSGFSVDNLDTKTLKEASSPFEKLFITIRETLEENESCCMDEEEERLQVCQLLSKKIFKRFREGLQE